MTLVFLILGLAIVAAAFWFVAGRLEVALPDAGTDLKPDERGGEPSFDVVLRGYRMDEVDATIADLRDRIAKLEQGRVKR